MKPKVVRHHDNPTNPDRCFVRLFKLYQLVLPKNRPNDSFYFHPLKEEPKQGCWFTPKPIGHNLLQGTVTRLCRKAGISGFRTNHSLRATTATRMYQASFVEQLILEWTSHHSAGVLLLLVPISSAGVEVMISLTRGLMSTSCLPPEHLAFPQWLQTILRHPLPGLRWL